RADRGSTGASRGGRARTGRNWSETHRACDAPRGELNSKAYMEPAAEQRGDQQPGQRLAVFQLTVGTEGHVGERRFLGGSGSQRLVDTPEGSARSRGLRRATRSAGPGD